MPNKKRLAKDKPLQDFLKTGGRKGAEADFDAILKQAAKQTKDSKPKRKSS